jgi:hypothetical protein
MFENTKSSFLSSNHQISIIVTDSNGFDDSETIEQSLKLIYSESFPHSNDVIISSFFDKTYIFVDSNSFVYSSPIDFSAFHQNTIVLDQSMDFSSSACCVSTNLLTGSSILTETMIHNESNIFLDSTVLSSTISLSSPSHLFDESYYTRTLDFDESSKLIYTDSPAGSGMRGTRQPFSGSLLLPQTCSLSSSLFVVLSNNHDITIDMEHSESAVESTALVGSFGFHLSQMVLEPTALLESTVLVLSKVFQSRKDFADPTSFTRSCSFKRSELYIVTFFSASELIHCEVFAMSTAFEATLVLGDSEQTLLNGRFKRTQPLEIVSFAVSDVIQKIDGQRSTAKFHKTFRFALTNSLDSCLVLASSCGLGGSEARIAKFSFTDWLSNEADLSHESTPYFGSYLIVILVFAGLLLLGGLLLLIVLRWRRSRSASSRSNEMEVQPPSEVLPPLGEEIFVSSVDNLSHENPVDMDDEMHPAIFGSSCEEVSIH